MVYILRKKNELNTNRIAFGYSLDSRLIPREEGGNSPLFFVYLYEEGRRGAIFTCILYVFTGERGEGGQI